MRSSPKRICGFIRPPLASTSPPNRLQRWPAIVVEPTSTATPKASSTNPGQMATTLSVADRGCRRAAGDRRVDGWQHVGGQVVDDLAVLFGDCGDHEVCGRQPGAEGGRGDLDVAQGEQRVDDELGQVEGAELLAHDLAVHLARRRDVDDGVAADRGGTAEAVPAGERSAAAVVPLERRPSVELSAGRRDVPLGEGADRGHDLAASADPPATAHAVEVDAELTGGGEHGRAVADLPGSPDGVNTTRCFISPVADSQANCEQDVAHNWLRSAWRSLDAAVEGELAEALVGVLGVEAGCGVLGGVPPDRRRTACSPGATGRRPPGR